MTTFLPILPQKRIIYPDECVVLNVEEERYVELVHDCANENKAFGIPYLKDGGALEYGTSMQILEWSPGHEQGLRVKAQGLKVFRILEFVKDLPAKKYAGAIVNYPENDTMKVHPRLSDLISEEVKRLYRALHIEAPLSGLDKKLTAYGLAHNLGLSQDEEYELLHIFNEVQRMEYLRRYFKAILPDLENLDAIKSRFNLN